MTSEELAEVELKDKKLATIVVTGTNPYFFIDVR